MRRAGLVFAALLALVLIGCSRGAAAPTQTVGGEAGQTDGAAGDAAAVPTAEPATATLARPQEIVLCSGPRPDALYGDPAAEDVLRLVRPLAVVFGDDYQVDGSELLTELPTEDDGTLRRSDDGTLIVTLRYRDDLVWSDGEPFDAKDALLGFSLPARGGLAPAVSVLDAAQLDPYTLELILPDTAEYPYVPLQPPLPAHTVGADFDPASLTDADLLSPALGPYALAADEGAALRLETNPNYPDADGYVDAVTVRFLDDPAQAVSELQTGACDLVTGGTLTAEALSALRDSQSAGDVQPHVTPGQVSEHLVLNTYTADSGRPAYFADVRVRQAVAGAINRAALAEELGGDASLVMDSWLPADHWAHPGADRLTPIIFNPDAAAALLDEAGWRDGDGDGIREYQGPGGSYACGRGDWSIAAGTPLAPVLTIPAGDPVREQIAQRVGSALAQIGMRVEVTPVAPETLYSTAGPLVQRSFDMALLASIARPDPLGVSRWVGAELFLHPQTLRPVHRWQLEDRWLDTEQMVERLVYSNIPGPGNAYQGQNFSGWCSEDANIALVQAEVLALSVPQRQPFYEQQQAIFTQEVPAVPLFARPGLAAASAEICGVQPGPVDPVTWNMAQWTYEEGGCPE